MLVGHFSRRVRLAANAEAFEQMIGVVLAELERSFTSERTG
jgi:hypothetical protein